MFVPDPSDQDNIRITTQRKSLLASNVSIPRVSIYKCDNCGDRARRKSNLADHQARPHSVHVDQENYLYTQHLSQVDFLGLTHEYPSESRRRNSRPRTCHFEPPDHVYEEVKKDSQMKTLDIRISQRKREIRRENEAFGDASNLLIHNTLDSDHSEKADQDFQFFPFDRESSNDKFGGEKVAVVTKVNLFRRNIMSRIRNLVMS